MIPNNPLAEVFGFCPDNHSPEAKRHRAYRLCPFNNHVPNCTKDKAGDPLGVCSIFDRKEVVITCPVRFRESWLIAEHAANFFFGPNATWTSLTEVGIKDRNGKDAGNIDIVLASYDRRGKVLDYGALEVQAVYISGNVRRPFEYYMEDPESRADMVWTGPHPPRPDYLSSSRKRLAPQLLYKGGIVNGWGKKVAVVLNRGFYLTLPDLASVKEPEADMAWLIYDLRRDSAENRLRLQLGDTVFTQFSKSLDRITRPETGDESEFLASLQARLDKKLDNGNPPDTNTIRNELDL